MSVIFNPLVTNAGEAAALNASANSLELPITHVAFGTGFYAPAKTRTALQAEVFRSPIASGGRISPNQLRMQSVWQDAVNNYAIKEIGIYSNSTLFAVWSRADGQPIGYKTAGVDFVFFYDLAFTSLPANSLSITADAGQSAILLALSSHLNNADAHPQYIKRVNLISEDALHYIGTVGGTANAITATTSASVTLASLAAGMAFNVKVASANTGAVTLNINGFGAIAVTKKGANPLIAGDIAAGEVISVLFDGTRFQLLGSDAVPAASETISGIVELATAAETVTGTDNLRAVHPAGLTSRLAGYVTTSGNAATATKLQTSRTISLSGDATGSIGFDGSANVTIPVVVVDDSHNHTSIAGNATTATTLQTARNIALSGDVTGTASFNGSANATIAATVITATDTVAGKVELATTAEALTGTDTTRAVTPAGLNADAVSANTANRAVRRDANGDFSAGNITVTNIISSRTGSQGAISGFRNRIINGACDIAQRRLSVAVMSGAGVYGGPDRFLAVNSNGGGQFTQSKESLVFQGLVRSTVRHTVDTAISSAAASNYWYGIFQIIEGFNSYDLRGKPVSVSFIFNTNVSGTYSVSLRDGASNQSYVTTIVAVANTPQMVKISVAAIPLAASIPNSNAMGLQISVGFLNTGTYQTATPNTWQSGNFASAAGATNWGATAGNFIELTELQLEEGSVATPFERRSYGAELALCQRYAEMFGELPSGFFNGGTLYFQSRGGAIMFLQFAVKKRAEPTFSHSAVADFIIEAAQYGANRAPTALLMDRGSRSTVQILIVPNALFDVGVQSGRFLCDTLGGYFLFDAELY